MMRLCTLDSVLVRKEAVRKVVRFVEVAQRLRCGMNMDIVHAAEEMLTKRLLDSLSRVGLVRLFGKRLSAEVL